MSIRLDGIKEEQVTDFILFYFIIFFLVRGTSSTILRSMTWHYNSLY